MANKRLKVGIIRSKKHKFGNQPEKQMISVGLGSSLGNPKYALNVELIVTNNEGKVLHRQTNGWVNVVDPRKRPKELYEAGLVTEDVYNDMLERSLKVPEEIKYELDIVPTSK